MSTQDRELDFPINQQLLEDATRKMEEWKVVRDRLQKIEEHKNEVSQKVYDRVRADYKGKYAKATDELLGTKEDIDREISMLNESRKKIEHHLEEHKHNFEEIKFRNTLGEFLEEDYLDKSRLEQDRISKFETILSAVDSNIERYNSIFEGEEIFVTREEPSKHVEELSEATDAAEFTPPPHAVEPMTDDAGYVIDESSHNYFATTQKDIEFETSPHNEESATARTDISNESKPAPVGFRPRLVVLSGENAGTAFTIKTTTSLGRAESNTIPLKDGKCSRQHSQIQQKGNEFVIVDLNSSNGTFVNGERVEEHVLSNGDEILLGDTLMQFQME